MQGAQEPRISHVPPYSSSAGDEAIELAQMAGLNLLPWQQWVLRRSLGERDDGKWAATEVGLVVGRQNGKNAILEARELAELFLIAPLVGPRLIIHSAHQFATAMEHFRRLQARVRNSPDLMAKVKHRGKRPVGIRESHGEESIELVDGSRILFKARSSSGGQGAGFTCDLLVWDEAWNLPEATVEMVVPTLAAKTLETPGVQTWYTSQAVTQQSMPYSVHLARIRERGLAAEDSRLFYAEWSIDENEFAANPLMAEDPVALEQANPSLGLLISLEHVTWERKGGLPWPGYLAHRLGIGDWPPTSEDAARVIPVEAWAQLADPSSRFNGIPAFAVDVDPDQAWATISAAGVREDGLYHVGVIEHQRGTGWVVDECKRWLERYPSAVLVVDPRSETSALLADMDDAAMQPVRASSADYLEACGGFFKSVLQKQLRYQPPQPELDLAVAGARTKSLGEAWKWTRKDATACITPLVSCTLALWGARTQGVPTVWSLADFVGDRDEIVTEPEPEPVATPGFVPLDQVPVRSGLFRP